MNRGWMSRAFVALLSVGGWSACANVPLEADASEDHAEELSASADPAGDAGIELGSSEQALDSASDFCWKDSYGRGAGSVPDACPGQQQDAGLCYPYCAAGYYGVGPVCWQACPAGYRDDGTACWLDSSIVNANNSKCPWYDVCGVTVARGCSTCPAGYRNDGCTCRRDVSMFYKNSYGRGAGAPRSCNPSLQSDAGLCYNYCNSGYSGVGPVCWGECPAALPVACGAGCAASTADCAEKVISQVEASLEMAGNIAGAVMSFGTSAAAKYVTKVGLSAAQKAALKEQIKREIKERAQSLAEDTLNAAAEETVKGMMGEEVDWSALDPTGIAAMVDAFNAPSCANFESNKALGRPAYQSSTEHGGAASRAVDGNTAGQWSGGSVTHTSTQAGAWWYVDLARSTKINRVVVHNRQDCCSERLSNFHVDVRDASNRILVRKNFSGVAGAQTTFDFGGASGERVVVELNGTNVLSLAEVQVMGI